jgi:hypothetical protein
VEAKARNRSGDFPLISGIGEACACKRKPDLRRGAALPEFPQIPRGRVLQSKTAPKGLLGKAAARWSKRKKTAHRAVFQEEVVEAAGIEPASRSTLQTVLHT